MTTFDDPFDDKYGVPQREPSADIQKAANTVHELHVALVRAGFEETVALHLISTILKATLGT